MRKNIIAGVLTVVFMAALFGLALLVNRHPEEAIVILIMGGMDFIISLRLSIERLHLTKLLDVLLFP